MRKYLLSRIIKRNNEPHTTYKVVSDNSLKKEQIYKEPQSTRESKRALYSVGDFIYRLEKYEEDIYEKKYTHSQIANLVGKAMIGFFEDTDTPY